MTCRYCDDGSLERSRAARQQQQQYNHDHNRTAASSKEFKTSLKMNPPRYSITGLKRSLLTPSVLLGNKDVVVEESQATHTQVRIYWLSELLIDIEFEVFGRVLGTTTA